MLVSICPYCQIAVPFVEDFEGDDAFCCGCGRHFPLQRAANSQATNPLPEGCRAVIVPLPSASEGQTPKSLNEENKPQCD